MSERISADALQPLIFTIIRALTPPDISIDFHDAMIRPLPDLTSVDAIALTVDTFAAKRAYAIADHYRELGIPVILGGYHPTMCAAEAARHADAVVTGEAEDTWPMLLADLASGRLQPRYSSSNHNQLGIEIGAEVPFRRQDYPGLGIVQFSRGCRYTCEFCSIHAFFGRDIRTKPVEMIVEEITCRPEKLLFFVDDNLFADRNRARELFEALIRARAGRGTGKRWVCQISMDVAEDPELLTLMRRAGCLMVLIGFETLAAENLKQMRKGANLRAGDYQQVITAIRRAGLMIYGTFVIGYDHDTPATAATLARFASEHGFSIANFNPLMTMPGTGLYDRMAAQDRLLHDQWWLAEDFRYGDAMYRPVRMTPDELTTTCRKARFAFYSPSSILRRGLHNAFSPTSLTTHLVANLISAKEIRAKQGSRLGARI